MGWGGAPPWVYKNEAAYHESNAMQANSEASKAKELATTLAADKAELTKQMNGILSEIQKYQEKKTNKKVTKKEMEEILEKINQIIKDAI